MPKNIRNVRIAPIWTTQADYEKANQHKVEVAIKIKKEMLEPFLQSGGLPRYRETGETLMICDTEFFVNDWYPREGIIDSLTILDIEVGFTREVFQRK